MAGIRDIRTILDRYPEIKYKSTDLDISISKSNDNGYDVYLTVHAEGITLYCDGWHREYDTIEQVWPDFVYALSTYWRIRVSRRGKSSYKWGLEIEKEGQWKKSWIVSLLFYPFWKKDQTVILKNDYFDSLDKLQEMTPLIHDFNK